MDYGRSLLNGGHYLTPFVYRSKRIPEPAKPFVSQLVREAGNRIPNLIYDQIRSRVFTTIEIPETDPAYEYVNDWASEQDFTQKSSKLRLNTSAPRYQYDSDVDFDGRLSTKNVRYHVAAGTYRLRYNNSLMWFTLREQKWGYQSDLASRRPPSYGNSIEIRVLGPSAAPIHALINEAATLAKRRTNRTINLWYGQSGWWDRSSSQRTRPLESVILPEGQREMIEKDVKRFIDQSDWYFDKAIPYRRGYLLYGLPGGGKSSLVLALASQFNLPIYVLNLATNRLSDNDLAQMLGGMAQPSILLLEDIDSLFAERDPESDSGSRDLDSAVSFSGLLNALDGVSASQGRLLFMTTNHLERLDPALIRPGRIDVRLEFTYADFYQAKELHKRFFPNADPVESSKFGIWVERREMSMADVQEHLLNQASVVEETSVI